MQGNHMTSKNETSKFIQEYSFIGETPSTYVTGLQKQHPRTHRSNVVTFTSRSSNGDDNPHYRDYIARKQDVTHKYSANFAEYIKYHPPQVVGTEKLNGYKGQSYSFYKRTGIYYPNQFTFGHASIPQSVQDSANQVLAGKLQAKILGMKANPQTIPFIVEAKTLARDTDKVARSFLDFLFRVFKLIRGDFSPKNLKKILADLADMWLAWSFTISPTINDTRELAGALAETISAAERTAAFSVYHTYDAKSSSSRTFVESMDLANLYQRTETYTVVEDRIFGSYIVKSSMPVSLNGIINNFNLDEWLPSIWELIPFSWVADYFVNVGQFLESPIYVDSDFIYLGRNSKKISQLKRFFEVIPQSSDLLLYDIRPTDGYMEGKYTSFTRTPMTAIGLPRVSLNFKDMHQISNYSVNKILNLSSILIKSQTH